MTREQFNEQFGRLSAEWPRSYGTSKQQMFAKEFGGHEYLFFTKVVDHLLRKFRYAPQISDVWSAISDVTLELQKGQRNKIQKPEKQWSQESGLSRRENTRRWKLLYHFLSDKDLQKRDPDWLRRKIWPNETKEETDKKYSKIMLEDAIKRKGMQH